MAVGIVLIIAALSLFVVNRLDDLRAGRESGRVLDELTGQIEEQRMSEVERSLPVRLSPEGEESGSSGRTGTDGYDYIGILTIPALGLELPVMADWDYPRLRVAPCRYTGYPRTGDLVIAGHNYSRHFGRLKDLAGGEDVYFTDMDGKVYCYVVDGTEILEPADISGMVDSGYPLTLFTCTYGGQTRVTVRCRYQTE